ncbi:MAG: hypothetical protein ACFFCS_13065 [Candidatus Hodarchaeota archaeon]
MNEESYLERYNLTKGQATESERFKSTRGSVRFTTIIIRIMLLLEIFLVIISYIMVGIVFITLPSHFTYSAIFLLSFGTFAAGLAIYLGFFHAEHRFSLIIVIVIAYLLIDRAIWNPFLQDNNVLGQWDALGYAYYACIGVFGVGVGFMVVHLFTVSIARHKQFKRERRVIEALSTKKKTKHLNQMGRRAFWHSFKKKKWVHIVFIPLLATTGFISAGMYFNWFTAGKTITIDPGNHEMELAIFSSMNPDHYEDSWKESMNNHSTLIVANSFPSLLSQSTWLANPFNWQENQNETLEYNQSKAEFIKYCNDWKVNYSNVRIMPVVQGVPCGYPNDLGVTNGSHGVGGTLWLARQYLEIAIENNLTNVVGIHADQEFCQYGWNITSTRDRARNLQATENWNNFFKWINDSYSKPEWQAFFSSIPDRDEFMHQTTFSEPSFIDAYDGDDDLDVFVLNNILHVPYWNDYSPMLYHEGANTADEANFVVYREMLALNDALQTKGLEDRIGAYLGITGVGIFSNGTQTQFSGTGQATVTGFDVLVRQGLIVKSFGSKRLTFFLGITYNEDNIGVFEAYGADFLDRYNSSVNGPGSDQPFEIPLKYTADQFHQTIMQDIILTERYHFEIIIWSGIAGSFVLAILSDRKIRTKMLGKRDETLSKL